MLNAQPSTTSTGVERVRTSIAGLEEITGGGLPRGRTTLLVGGPGSGKTVLALQTLVSGIQHNEPGIFVAFEEWPEQVLANAGGFGWNLPALQPDRLFLLNAQISPNDIRAGEFDLSGMLALLSAKRLEIGATRIVFDGIDVLLSMLNNTTAEMRELYRLRDWLYDEQLTGILTAKDSESPSDHRYRSAIQFMADCVICLDQSVETGVSSRKVQVTKFRGAGFSEGEFPMSIGCNGIEVAAPGRATADFDAREERVTAGFDRLDTMLGGGYFRGSSIVISGAPGTSKTTLACAFINAACERGERALYVSFDEGGNAIRRNLTSVGICLEPHVQSGNLHLYSGRTEVCSAEEHLIRLSTLIAQHRPTCMVVDPLSALTKVGRSNTAQSVAGRLLHLAKNHGITLLVTTLVATDDVKMSTAELHVSTLADVWIHLSYLITGGERNRAINIVKARGTSHSNQVRELILSNDGLSLSDVYLAGGDVLMGTLRWEREAEERASRLAEAAELERRFRTLKAAESSAVARVTALNDELEGHRVELDMLTEYREAREALVRNRSDHISGMRSADASHAADL